MRIGINNKFEIKQIDNITDVNLTTITLDENSDFYPFRGFSKERMLCYCYKEDENGVSVYPYVNTDKITEIEQEVLKLQSQVIDLEFEKIAGGVV